MLKCAPVFAAGALVVAVFAIAVTGPAAIAAAPKCLNKANQHVACTDTLKAKTNRRKAKFDGFLETPDIKGETRRGPRLRGR